MEFILNEYHCNISDSDLLNDLKSVAKHLNKSSLSQKEYALHGKYGANTFRRHFGSWNVALTMCGLEPNVYQRAASQSKSLYRNISNDGLLSDIRSVASTLKKDTLSSNEYSKYGKFSKDTCLKRFGNWNCALTKAGLKPYIQKSEKRIQDTDLLEEIERLWIKLGRQPTVTDIKNGLSKYALNTFTRHFGGWRGALKTFMDWIEAEKNTPSQITNESVNCFDNSDPVYLPTVEHSTGRDVNLRLRFKVMSRDHFKCCFCGASPATDPTIELHVDHIFPWSKGGETVIDNLQTLCSKCNLGKADLVETPKKG